MHSDFHNSEARINSTRPNILILHTDEQLYSQLGCMGNRLVHTPNIDQLANTGMLFHNAYTCSGVCVPSRASLMTGRYPTGHGICCNFQTLPSSEVTMGRRFSEAGYATGYFGKTHYGQPDDRIKEDGWTKSFVWHTQYNEYLQANGINVHYPEKKEIRRSDIRYWAIGTSNIPLEHYFEQVIADSAINFIRQHKQEPFLCFVANIAPHSPFSPPEPYDFMYRPEDMELTPRHEGDLLHKPLEFVTWVEQNRKYVNEEELRIYLAHIYGLITLVDDNVGCIVQALKDAGVYDNTIIVFTSDHGDYDSAYGILGKSWSMDDCLMRVPLIISHPDDRSPRETDALTDNTDLLPTLLDAAGMSTPPLIHGNSLMPLLRNETVTHRQEVFGHNAFYNNQYQLMESMVRRENWKYIRSTGSEGTMEQLFNLETDPQEVTNLAAHSEHSPLCRELSECLLDWHVDNHKGFFDFETEEKNFWETRTRFFDEKQFTGG